jgi:hypothetical protein
MQVCSQNAARTPQKARNARKVAHASAVCAARKT